MRDLPFLLRSMTLGSLSGAVLIGSVLLASPAPAADTAAAEGIGAGAKVPRFMLPVVNPDTFTNGRKWGPNKWVGQTAKPEEKKKVMIMSFFATWCEPCKKEMPELARLYETYGKDGLGVMLVSIDERKDREALTLFAKDKALPFPVVHDAWGVVARRYKYPGRLPYLVMASGDGLITSSHVGYKEEFKDELETMVKSNLGLTDAAPAPTTDETAAADTTTAAPEAESDKGKKKKRKGKKRRKKKKKKKGEG